jgi:hypothetical protein
MMRRSLYGSQAQRFSRTWWLETARSLVWVVLVTILIWVYADMRFTDRRTMVTTIHFMAPASSNLALISRGDVVMDYYERRVRFEVEGSREVLDRFEREYRDSVVYDVARDAAPGEQAIDTRSVLNSDPQITERGLRVIAAEPPSITVRLDRLIRRTVPVELAFSGADLVGQPKAAPVGVIVPETEWKKILDKMAAPALKSKEVDLSSRPTGKSIEVEFEIFPEIAGIPVRLEQNTVKVTLEIRQRTAKKSFVVTVRVLVPPEWDDLRKYELVRKDPLE